MSDERYPQDLAVSLEDFRTSGWKEAIAQANRKGYSAMQEALWAASHSARDQGRVKHSKVLRLLANACSTALSPWSPNEPFKPNSVFDDHRSVIPDNLTDADITFVEEIVDAVDENWLKARLSDLLWLISKPRNPAFALKAIDAYRCLPLDTYTCVHGGSECWQRAISLARMLKQGAGDRLQQMEASIVAAFNTAKRNDGSLGLCLANLLISNGLGQAYRASVAKRLEALARQFDGEGELRRARDYFSSAAEWYRLISDGAKAAEMTVAVAEGWVKEAVARTASDSPSHMAAASCYEKAILTYRTVPQAERATHRADERIAELQFQLEDSRVQALGEMVRIQTPGEDITELVEGARKSVTGKSAQQALLAFTNLHQGVNTNDLRAFTLNEMCQNPLLSYFPASLMSGDGRVVAKHPGMSWRSEPMPDDEIAIRAAMISEYRRLINDVVQGNIWPALEVLLIEHRLREADFIALAINSPIVPKDRAGLFGKALFAGYERDFITALHLLIPQIEHLIRVHLKQAGVGTIHMDNDGIQTEKGMNSLLVLPEAAQVFGEDLVFELNSLFCDAFGPNLRNKLAHGLLDEKGCHSTFAVYAWWLAMRLTINPWWSYADGVASQQEVNTEQTTLSTQPSKSHGEP